VIEHTPVLTDEVIKYLRPRRGDTILDATVGCGSHASKIIERVEPNGLLLGIDIDDEAIHNCKKKLQSFKSTCYRIIKSDFRNIDLVLKRENIRKVDGALFDLGVSMLELGIADRGFAIRLDGPLDMRMDRQRRLNAHWVINKYAQNKLESILKEYGEERYARKIARFITEKRSRNMINTTFELADIVKKAVGYRSGRSKIHPATRTFQAIRIEVNDELNALREALRKLPDILNEGARICVISFHSLEDRIVKAVFREYAKKNIFELINKKPITPSFSEINKNPRARSAKLRVAEFRNKKNDEC